MKFIYKNIVTGTETIKNNYLRKNLSEPIEGAKDLLVYMLEDKIPKYNIRSQRIINSDISLTDKQHDEYPHILVAYQLYDVIDIPKEEVIENLNQEFYNYLDINYPLVERQKDSDELSFSNPSQERIDLITNKKSWEWNLRIEKRNRIEKYINEDIFPSFEFKPLNII